jgi:hypothetical protein
MSLAKEAAKGANSRIDRGSDSGASMMTASAWRTSGGRASTGSLPI